MKKITDLLYGILDEPLKIVRFGWVVPNAVTAGSRALQNASPASSRNPEDIPTGYTFVSWLQFNPIGWVGALVGEMSTETTEVWLATAKPATTAGSISIFGYALYLRNDLI